MRDLSPRRTLVAFRFPSLRSTVVIAAFIALSAVLLNVAVARSLVRIGTNAQALVGGWIRSASSLADFEQGLRDFRQREARYALAEVSSIARSHRSALDSLHAQIDGSLAQLHGSAPDGTFSARVQAVARSWSEYTELHRDAPSQTRGEGSAAIQAFREREPRFQQLTSNVRAAQQTLREGAGQMAVRNRRTTLTSAALLGTSVLLTLAALARADAARAEVIVSDLSMPGASGLDFAARLRTVAPRVPLVLISGYLDDANSERAWALGVRLQLHKPVKAADLLRAVDESRAAAQT